MYRVEKGTDFTVEHTSIISAPILGQVDSPNARTTETLLASPVHGKLELGPFIVEYELFIDEGMPIDSHFVIVIHIQTGSYHVGAITLIHTKMDKYNAQVGFNDYGVKALVEFDMNSMELRVTLGAFERTYRYTLFTF